MLTRKLFNFENIDNHNIIFPGDFNICQRWYSNVKSRSINKLTVLKKTLDLCDLWRLSNPIKCKYTFRQKHLAGIIQRRLDYIFISQSLHEYVKKSDVLNAFSTDHSLAFCSISK